MALDEFSIIQQFFSRKTELTDSIVEVGIGDDAAVLAVPAHEQLVTSVDTMVKDVHFTECASAADIGYRSLAISLSDIAAMGARPHSVLLSLTLPDSNETWLQDFANGFFACADEFKVQLIGGNITRGALTVSTVVNGWVAQNMAIRRSTAQVGDLIYLTSSTGDASLACDLLKSCQQPVSPVLLQKFLRPKPRVQEGLLLSGIANAAIDTSDGLVADLSKIVQASGLGAKLNLADIPLSEDLRKLQDLHKARQYALSASDDYELCFTVPCDKQAQLEQRFADKPVCFISCIGKIVEEPGVKIYDKNNQQVFSDVAGYLHFR